MAKYKITNFGNTRKFPYKGEYYEITKNGSIETEDEQLAKEFSQFLYVDVEVIEQPIVETSKRNKKKSPKQKKKATTGIHKKTKQRKNKRRIK